MLTHGSEDPTRAGLAFHFAKGAVEAGHQPTVVLGGDAAVLAREDLPTRPELDALLKNKSKSVYAEY